jgi:hypothetical protein
VSVYLYIKPSSDIFSCNSSNANAPSLEFVKNEAAIEVEVCEFEVDELELELELELDIAPAKYLPRMPRTRTRE